MSPETELQHQSSRRSERWFIVAVLVLFAGFTLVALAMDGLVGIVHAITYNWMSVQIFIDLVLAVVVLDIWIHRDARASGKNPWPWLVASLISGMFSPLIYFLAREGSGPATDRGKHA